MTDRMVRYFVHSAAILLLITALAKLTSSAGNAKFLSGEDPIFGISYRNLLWSVGLLEFATALICFMARSVTLKVALVAWLSSSFVIYRLGLILIGYSGSCPCLGNLTDAIGMSQETADRLMIGVLLFLLIGSYSSLYYLRRRDITTSGCLSGTAHTHSPNK